MYMRFCLLVSLCTMFGPGARKDQKRVLDLLELETEIIITNRVSVENPTLVLCKSN